MSNRGLAVGEDKGQPTEVGPAGLIGLESFSLGEAGLRGFIVTVRDKDLAELGPCRRRARRPADLIAGRSDGRCHLGVGAGEVNCRWLRGSQPPPGVPAGTASDTHASYEQEDKQPAWQPSRL